MAQPNDDMEQLPGHLKAVLGLARDDLAGIEELAAACVAVDGGRLKLEWRTIKTRPADEVSDFLWMAPEGVVGFLGLYGFRSDQVEICGMVHPSWRRQGIFSRLFEAAVAEAAKRGAPHALLVVDRLYEAGAAFARAAGGTIEHSEHRMVLGNDPAAYVPDPLVWVRPAEMTDAAFVVSCLAEAFDLPAPQLQLDEIERLANAYPGTFVIERGTELVGTIRVERGEHGADIYGFAVSAPYRGRGIGRQVLSGIARQLVSEGVSRVGLEVSVSNDSALGLYRSCGFEVTGTEDYYEVQLTST